LKDPNFMRKLQKMLDDRQIDLNIHDDVIDFLAEEGFDPAYGARPLRRAIMRLLEDSLAEAILSGKVNDSDRALVDVSEDDKVIVSEITEPVLAEALLKG